MPAKRVIRIDDEVWAELQRQARPLEDTPNSVLRRMMGLPDARNTAGDITDPRVTDLLEVVEELLGQIPQFELTDQGYAVSSESEKVIAYIRPRKGRLRVGTPKELAQKTGLSDWDAEFESSRMFEEPSVRWYVPDGDSVAIGRVAAVLATLWREDDSAPASLPRREPASRVGSNRRKTNGSTAGR